MNVRHLGAVTEKWHSAAGDEPKRDLGSLREIAEVVSRFDVIAVQEVQEDITCLRYMLRLLGDAWAMILTDVTKGSAGRQQRAPRLHLRHPAGEAVGPRLRAGAAR